MKTIAKRSVKHSLLALLLMAGSANAADLRIGGIFPLSGPSSGSFGDPMMAGANLAVKHINEDHLLEGQLSISYEDSQASQQQGVIAMNKLVNVAKVPYVLSSVTGVIKATSVIANNSKTVTINGGAVGPDLASLGAYIWNVIPLAQYEVRAMIPYLVKERNLKRMVLVYVDDPTGQAIRETIEKEVPASGGELVDSLSVPNTMQQFSSIAARVRRSKPDVVYIASYGTQQVSMIKQLRDNGVTQQLASYSSFSAPNTASLPQARGSLYTTQRVDWDANDSLTKRFVADYRKQYSTSPNAYSANYYNAVRLFATLAASLQKNRQPITGENLLAERARHPLYDFVGGSISFAKDNSVVAPMQINEIDGDGGKVVKVIPIAGTSDRQ